MVRLSITSSRTPRAYLVIVLIVVPVTFGSSAFGAQLGAGSHGPAPTPSSKGRSVTMGQFSGIPVQQAALTAVISNVVYFWSCIPLSETVYLFGNGTGGFPPYQFNWSFGDGSPTESGQNVSHTYPGLEGLQVHNVTLWVTDSHGGNASTEQGVSSAPPPCPLYRSSASVSEWPLVVGFGMFGVIAATMITAVHFGRRKGGLGPNEGKRAR